MCQDLVRAVWGIIRRGPSCRVLLTFMLIFSPIGGATAVAAIYDVTWNGGGGDWIDPGNWDLGVVPDNGSDTYNVFIDGGKTGSASDVWLDAIGPMTVNELWIDAGDALTVINGTELAIAGGLIDNCGTMNLGEFGVSDGTLRLEGSDMFLCGTGVLDMYDGMIIGSVGTERLIQEAGHTIRGNGCIGNASMTLTNRGVIEALDYDDLVIATLNDPSQASYNAGTIRTGWGRHIDICESFLVNQEMGIEGLIHADMGEVELIGSTVTGGVLQLDGPGPGAELRLTDNSRIAGAHVQVNIGTIHVDETSLIEDSTLTLVHGAGWLFLEGGTVSGGLIDNHDIISVYGEGRLSGGNLLNRPSGEVLVREATLELGSGTYTNDGLITLGAGYPYYDSAGDLVLDGERVTLAGTGVLEMENESAIYGANGGEELVNEAGHTIRGSGGIGVVFPNQVDPPPWWSQTDSYENHSVRLINRGLIDAVGEDGLTIGTQFVLFEGPWEPWDPDEPSINSGTIRASLMSDVSFWGCLLSNQEGDTDGLLHADGGTVELFVSSVGGGKLQADGMSGLLKVGGIDGWPPHLPGLGSQIDGATIDVNEGTLRATNGSIIAGSTIDISPWGSAEFINAIIEGGTLTNAGRIDVDDSPYDAALTLTGGNLDNRASGRINVDTTELKVGAGSYTNWGQINLGVVDPNSGTSSSGWLHLTDELVAFEAAGVLNLNGADSYIVADDWGWERLVNQADHTIRGRGRLGDDGAHGFGPLALTNRGLIEATYDDMYGGLLEIFPYNTFDPYDPLNPDASNVNAGTIRAAAGAEIAIVDGPLVNQEDDTLGLIHADDGLVGLYGADVIGGRFQVDGMNGQLALESSQISAADIDVNAGSLWLDGTSKISGSTIDISISAEVWLAGGGSLLEVNPAKIEGGAFTNAGTIQMIGEWALPAIALLTSGNLDNRPSGQINIDDGLLLLDGGTYTNDGVIDLGVGEFSVGVIGVHGEVALTGTGVVNVNSDPNTVPVTSGIGAYGVGGSGDGRLTNEPGHTIQGTGWIGEVPVEFLDMAGLDREDLAGEQLLPTHMSLTNRGVVQAVGGEAPLTIKMANDLTDPNVENFNAGTLRAAPGAELRIESTVLANQEGADPGLIHADNGTVVIDKSRVIGGEFLVEGPDGVLATEGGAVPDPESLAQISGAHIDVNQGRLRVGESSAISDSAINVAPGARVELDQGVIEGGTLTNAGTIEVSDSQGILFGGNLINTPSGQVNICDANLVLGSGTYVNDGMIHLGEPDVSFGNLFVNDGVVTLAGSGVLTMNGADIARGAYDGDRLVNEADHTIRGSGDIGGPDLFLTNRGTIEAAGDLAVLNVELLMPFADPYPYGTPSSVNAGTFRAGTGTELNLVASALLNQEDNTNGLIHAANGQITLDGSVVTGGQFQVDGPDGALRLEGYEYWSGASGHVADAAVSVNDGVPRLQGDWPPWPWLGTDTYIADAAVDVNEGLLWLDEHTAITNSTVNVSPWGRIELAGGEIVGGALNNAGDIDVVQDSTLSGGNLNNHPSGTVNLDWTTLILGEGSYHNDGWINLGVGDPNFGYSTGDLLLAGQTVTLTGSGVLDMHVGLIDAAALQGERLINEAGHTIRGTGYIGGSSGGSIALTNRGLIEAMPETDMVLHIMTLENDPNGSPVTNVNAGTIRAGTEAELMIADSVLANQEGSTNGLIHADGGTVTLSSSAVTGGNLQVDGMNGLLELVEDSQIIAANIDVNDGALWVEGNSRISGSAINVASGATLTLAGNLFFPEETPVIEGGTLTNSGVVHVGTGLGPPSGARLTGGNLNNQPVGHVYVDWGFLEMGSGRYVNDGTIHLGTIYDSLAAISVDGMVRLSGAGVLEMGEESIIAAHDSEASTVRLTNEAGHTIQGMGHIGGFPLYLATGIEGSESLPDFDLTNRGLIDANVDGEELWIDPTGDLLNTGTLRASNGGTLRLTAIGDASHNGTIEAVSGGTVSVETHVAGSGSWLAEGGTITLTDVSAYTTGPISVLYGGALELIEANLSGSDLIVDETSTLSVQSTLALTGSFAYSGTDESSHFWDIDATLEMNGGVGASMMVLDDWACLEVGGTDLGIDPNTYTGDPNGFFDNFDLSTLVIGPGSHVLLTDLFDNGNRGGMWFDEALYVDTLVFADAQGILNLNGLHLYVAGSIIGDGTIVVPEPATVALLLLGGLACVRRRRSPRRAIRMGEARKGI